jgi:hypothetical protein
MTRRNRHVKVYLGYPAIRACALVRIATLFCSSSLLVFAQEFEVASIKQSGQNAQAQTSAGLSVDGSMVRYSALGLKLYLGMAYRLKNYQLVVRSG